MKKIIVEGQPNDCLAIAALLCDYSSCERLSDSNYIFIYPDKDSALKSLIYVWNKIKDISDEADGLSENKNILIYKHCNAYIDCNF